MSFTFDHMHILTRDVEATATWFERMLGAEVIRSTQHGKPRVDLKLGGANIFLADLPANGNANPANPYQGLDHFGLLVKDIHKVVSDLKAKGLTFTTEPHEVRPGTHVAFFRTPDGVRIELLQRG